MRLKTASLLAIFIVTALFTALNAQNEKNFSGKDFYFSYLPGTGASETSIHITTQNATTITLTALSPFISFSFSMAANRDTIIQVNPVLTQVGTIENIENKAVHITSTQNINLLLLNNNASSADGIAVAPVENLPKGSDFIINAFRGTAFLPSQIMFVAAENNTLIRYTPSVNTSGGKLSGNTYSVTLNKGQVFLIQAQDTFDLTGTVVSVDGCKKLYVYQGAVCSRVSYTPQCSDCDLLWNASIPTQLWGNTYVTIPFKNHNSGYFVKVVAKENSTPVFVNGFLTATINAGKSTLINIIDLNPKCISSSKPISVVQLMKSSSCNGHNNGLGGPSSLNLFPVEQWINRVHFTTPEPSYSSTQFDHFFVVQTKTSNINTIKLDGNPIPVGNFTPQVSGCGNYSMAVLNIPRGKHVLQSDSPVIAYLYGIGNLKSYAMEIGGSLESKEFNFNSSHYHTCDTALNFTFNGIGDKITSWDWDFDDGTTANGNPVSHVYGKKGTYRVRLVGTYDVTGKCNTDTLYKTVNVYRPPYFTFNYDTLYCDGEIVTLSPFAGGNNQYRWNNGSSQKTYTLAGTETVILTMTDSFGCTHTDSIKIRFKDCSTSELFIPNVMTVNGDGVNDLFELRYDTYEKVEGQIFNRWGNVVYDFTFPDDAAWNGGINNNLQRPCPAGTYYYIIKAYDNDTKIVRQRTGVITLIRN